jgi:hypothetical protein
VADRNLIRAGGRRQAARWPEIELDRSGDRALVFLQGRCTRILDDFKGAHMIKAISFVLLVGLAGCSGIPRGQLTVSPCLAGEASYECQIERYNNVNVN